MSYELGVAYVQIVPSLRGASATISRELGGAGTQASRVMGQSIVGGIAGAAAAAARTLTTKLSNGAVAASRAVGSAIKNLPTTVSQAAAKMEKAFVKLPFTLKQTGKALETIGTQAPQVASQVGAAIRKLPAAAKEASSHMSAALSVMKGAAAALPAPIRVAGKVIGGVIHEATWGVRMFGKASAAIFGGLGKVMSTPLSKLGSLAKSAFTGLCAGAAGAGRAMVSFAGAMGGVVRHVGAAASVMRGAFSGVMAPIMSLAPAMSVLWEKIFRPLGSVAGRAVAGAGRALAGLTRVAVTVGGGIARAIGAGLSSIGSQVSRAVSGVAAAASSAATVAGTAIGIKIASGLGKGIQRYDTITNFPKVMQNFGISADVAKESITSMSEALNGLPTPLDAAVRGVQRLVSKNGDLKVSEKMFLAVNNAILAGGAPMDLQTSAMEQLTQAYSRGSMDMMEWRTLQMAMPAQLKQVAQAMGMETEALGTGLREGKISMDDFMATIEQLNTEGADGFLSFTEQARNATGGLQTMMANIDTAIARGWQKILTSFGQERMQGILNNIRTSINDGFESVLPIVEKLGEVFDKVSAKYSEFAQKFPVQTMGVKIALGGLMAGGFTSFASQLPLIGGMFRPFAMLLGGLTSPIMLVGAALVGLVATCEPVRNALMGFITTLFDANGDGALELADVMGTLQNALTAIQPIFQAVIEPFKAFIETLVGTLAQNVAIVPFVSSLTSLGGALGQVAASIVPVIAQIASGLVPIMTAAGMIIGQLIAAIVPMIVAILPSIVSIIGSIVAVAGNLIRAILPVIANLLVALAPVIAQIVAFIGQIVVAIAPLIATLIAQLVPVINNIVSAVANLIIAILPVVSSVLTMVMGLINALLPILIMIIQVVVQIATVVVTVVANIIAVVINVVAVIVSVVGTIISAIANVATLLLAGAQAIITGITVCITTVIGLVAGVVNGIINIISSLVTAVTSAITGLFSKIANIFSNIVSIIVSAGQNVYNSFTGAMGNLVSSVSGKINSILSFFQGLPGKIMSVFAGAGSWLRESGQRIIQGLIDGITNMIGKAKDAVSNVMQGIRNFLPFSPAKEGPFSGKGWTLYSGRSIVEALAEGVSQRGNLFADAVEDTLDQGHAMMKGYRPTPLGYQAINGVPNGGSLFDLSAALDGTQMTLLVDGRPVRGIIKTELAAASSTALTSRMGGI